MKIGVFDSGIGGKSVANAITAALPSHEVIFASDTAHVPYGNKQPDEIFGYVVPILGRLVDQGCAVLVIACNTVSTTLVGRLRQQFTVPIVAVEPMVKPAAALTRSGVIAVCATPTTLQSPRYAELKAEFAKDIKVIEPDCSNWSYMIEHNQVDEKAVEEEIKQALVQGADVIALGCTHYHWIEAQIKRVADGRAEVIQPEPAIVAELTRVLGRIQ